MLTLLNQIAVVTGAGRGIGRGIALALAEAGADVAINDLGPGTDAEEVAAAVRRLGRKAIVVLGDVSRLEEVERIVAETVAAFGKLDIAVSNAAFSDREPFHVANLEGFRRTVDVTMWGAFHLLRTATRQMLAQGPIAEETRGSIVIISSPHAWLPIPRSMAYNMAKAAIDQMARTAALELTEQRIRVNLIHPGWIDTPGERKFTSDEQIAAAAGKLPWKRLGTPEDIGRGVVFLCDPRSDYMTGSSLLIDGGISLPWWANRGSAVPE